MSLFKDWSSIVNSEMTQEQYSAFWNGYLSQEKSVYETILGEKTQKLQGTVSQLAEKFGIEPITFVGFLDGINTSLDSEIDLEPLTDESEIDASIDFEKLFYNMHEAKASWLYEIKAWDEILTKERRKEIKKEWQATKTVVNTEKIGRNDPCPCGSGKKYKKCCGAGK